MEDLPPVVDGPVAMHVAASVETTYPFGQAIRTCWGVGAGKGGVIRRADFGLIRWQFAGPFLRAVKVGKPHETVPFAARSAAVGKLEISHPKQRAASQRF